MGKLRAYQDHAIFEAVSRRTLAVSPKGGEELATAVAVECKDKRYVVTARHVVRNRDLDDIFFLFRPDQPYIVIRKADLPRRVREASVRERFRLPLRP
jgi:hypothetical protein